MRKFLYLMRVHPESQCGAISANQIEIPDWPTAITDDAGNTYTQHDIAPERGSCSWYAAEHRPPSRVTLYFRRNTSVTIVLD